MAYLGLFPFGRRMKIKYILSRSQCKRAQWNILTFFIQLLDILWLLVKRSPVDMNIQYNHSFCFYWSSILKVNYLIYSQLLPRSKLLHVNVFPETCGLVWSWDWWNSCLHVEMQTSFHLPGYFMKIRFLFKQSGNRNVHKWEFLLPFPSSLFT